MSVVTWADRPDYVGKPAALVTCPCCGLQRAADMIVYVGDWLDSGRRAQVGARMHVAAEEYLCTAKLSRARRLGLVTRAQLPRRR